MTVTAPASFSKIRAELGVASATPLSMNDPACRALAGVPSGEIKLSDFIGKSATPTLSINVVATTPGGIRDRLVCTVIGAAGATSYAWTGGTTWGATAVGADTDTYTVTGPLWGATTRIVNLTIRCTVVINGVSYVVPQTTRNIQIFDDRS